MSKHRIYCASATGLLMIAGLFSRSAYFPEGFIKTYIGDTIWAAMIFFGFGFIFHRLRGRQILIRSLFFCYVIEFLQFYHAPWIDSIRNTTIGGLILGFDFAWTDLVCYTIGVVLAYLFSPFKLNESM